MAVRTVTIEVKMDISNAEGKITTLTGSLKLLGDEVKKTGKGTDDFERLVTKNMRDGETAVQSLTRRSKELRGEISNLKNEFGRSANKSVLGDLEKTEADLKKIKGFLSHMGDDGGLAGHKYGDGFLKEFTLSFRTFPEFLASPIGGTLTAVLAPALIAGVAAAITAGVGLGIVGAAAFIEHNNPRIQAVFAPLKNDLINIGKDSAQPLVDPIVGALASIDVWAKKEQPQFKALFESVAPSVGLIAGSFEKLISDLVPALTRVGKTFTSVFKDPEVQASLNGVSEAFASMFNAIGNHPREVADGILFINGVLKGTLGLLKDILLIVGPVVEFLRQIRSVGVGPGADPGLTTAQMTGQAIITNDQFRAAGGNPDNKKPQLVQVSKEYADAAKAANNFADSQQEAADMVAAAAAAAKNAVPDYAALSSQLGATTANANTLAGQLTDKVIGAMLGVDVANNNFNKSLVTVGDTIVALGGNLTQHVKALKKTETGQQQETDAVLAAIQANLQVYDAQIAAGVGADDAAAAYDRNSAQLDAQVKAAGKVPPAVQKLIDKYSHVPDKVNTIIAMEGLTDAITNLNSTLLLLRQLDNKNVTANVDIVYHTKGRPNAGPLAKNISRWGNIYQHADIGLTSAGIYSPPTRYAFAEPQTGGEAFIPRLGNYARSMGIIQAAAGWYGAHVIPGTSRGGSSGFIVEVSFAPGAPSVLRDLVRVAVKETGQGVVKALTPR